MPTKTNQDLLRTLDTFLPPELSSACFTESPRFFDTSAPVRHPALTTMDSRRPSTTQNRHATGPPTPGHVAPLPPSDSVSTRSVLPVLQGNQSARRPSRSNQSVTSSNAQKTRSSTMTLMLSLHPDQSPPNLSPPAVSPSSSSSDPSSPSASSGGLMNRFKRMRGSVSSQGTQAGEPHSSSSGSMAQWTNNSDDLLGVREIPGRGRGSYGTS